MLVREVLERKGSQVETIEVGASLSEAVRRFAESKHKAFVVTDAGRLAGILALRDVLVQIDAHGAGGLEEEVRGVMVAPVASIDADSPVTEAHKLFTAREISHLPVVESGELCGILTPVDMLAHTAGDADRSELMRAYITGCHF